jgi:NADP-dependent 3-hydroxy acid dehydrogenase YdfG
MNLSQKNAIVTGCSKGIGLAICHSLLEKGVKVVGWSRTKPTLNDENFHHFSCNVGDWEQVQSVFAQTKQTLDNTVDIIVHNAGLGYQANFEELDVEEWHEMFNTNVHSIFYLNKLAIPMMKQQEESHIINISSIAGTNGVETMAGYCATKHAVVGISHTLFKELRQWGIKVTNIMPGSVNTNFFDDIASVQANQNMMRPQDIAYSVIQILETHPNYLVADLEVRPLRPKGK